MKKLLIFVSILGLIIGSFSIVHLMAMEGGGGIPASAKITLKSNDGQEFALDRALALHIGSHKHEIAKQETITLEVPGSVLHPLVLLLKFLKRAGDESKHSNDIFTFAKTIKNPATIDTLIHWCERLEFPSCILYGLQHRKGAGYSIQEILDSHLEFPVCPPGTLNLSGKNIASLEGLENIPSIRTVEALNVSDNALEYIDPQAFKACKQIKRLYLSNNRIARLIPENFSTLAHLEYFHCCNNQITILPEHLFRHCKNLQLIDFAGNPFCASPFTTIHPKAIPSGTRYVFLKKAE